MTPQQLKALILAQPNGSAIRTAYDRGDAECAAALNAKTIAKYIPRRHMLSVFADDGLILPVIDMVVLHNKMPDGTTPDFSTIFAFCSKLRWVLESREDNLRTPIDERLDAGCNLFASYAGMTAQQLKNLLTSGAGKISIYEDATELDAVVTPEEVAAARAA